MSSMTPLLLHERSPMYKVTFSSEGIADVAVMLDQQPVQVSGGYGGWTVQSRQRRVGLTVWQGKDPIRMTVPVLFDGVAERVSQEVLISRLSRMALPPATGGEPPQVTVSGTGLPNPGPRVWVIENLQWGTNVIRDFSANGVHARLRQDCVVGLLQYVDDDVVAFKAVQPGKVHNANPGTPKKTGWPKTYTVQQGDTLSRIAAKPAIYGDASKWKLIADANGIRDPNHPPVGKTIKLPAPS